ncbi:MAG TPA: endolytic transglycosylase MltG [Deltaproteobacteria bacterium]|nr:endolytic transglycosylase MltG [Deltaproteobacteria bacterium]
MQQSAELLKQNGILRQTWTFRWLARWRNVAEKLKPGEYQFAPDMTVAEVLNKIVRGDRVVHKLTIPEGFTFAQVAALLEKNKIAPQAEVLALFRDPKLLGELDFPAVNLEGYLFPATYEYDRESTAAELLAQMVQSFKRNFSTDLRERAMQRGWSIPQVVTLASIIEKETGQAGERALISAVFHNRLRLGMPLQTDPTVIYGLPHFDGNLRREDLRNPHPYNTYVHIGLPPGPIASPGKASLEAALSPSSSDYLFFVAKGDGTHQFSATIDEHNAAVAKYQLRKIPGAESQATSVSPTPETKPSPTPKVTLPLMKPVPMPRNAAP